MHFSYQETFKIRTPETYDTLFADVMLDDATFFMPTDKVESLWSGNMPILNAWENTQPVEFPNYQAGTMGPEASEVLIAQDYRSWLQPAFAEDHEGTQSQGSAESKGA